MSNPWIPLERDCDAIIIPDGDTVVLKEGTEVMVMQSLGGSTTVRAENGHLLRISNKDLDAIGREPAREEALDVDPATLDKGKTLELAWDRLKQVYDPEIPVNVVELGLVYELGLADRPEGGYTATLRMSLTAPGCGMGDVLVADARERLLEVPGIEAVDAQITFDPVWSPDMMTQAARLQLGML